MNTVVIISVISSVLAVKFYLRHKKASRYVIDIETDKCVGCARCVNECRHRVLDLSTKSDGKGRVACVTAPSRCTACGHCTGVCKSGALRLVERDGRY